ncbi:hypothetical protein FIM25_06190 [Desulfobotulus mexicanus]|uniref:Uncharacterized protein n=1 Tax=Desulfobotulus mexicanus TaxID=2586642 RepID=A0A5Q4VC72_9BACT|nr:hypothetical protein FIM25_06190 [Desulfobotulus mexicanus]
MIAKSAAEKSLPTLKPLAIKAILSPKKIWLKETKKDVEARILTLLQASEGIDRDGKTKQLSS